MGSLTIGKQQMCEIAKALSHDAEVIVFDEPTATLTETEIEQLFKIIKGLRDKGLAIVYISHRMNEIKMITDRVTVMRDGAYVGTLVTEDCTKDDIINNHYNEETEKIDYATFYPPPGSATNITGIVFAGRNFTVDTDGGRLLVKGIIISKTL